MQADTHDEGRPPAKERPHNVTAGDFHSVGVTTDLHEEPRCRMCGHVITSDESIEAGIGRDCRRRLRAALKSAEPDVLAACATVLGGAA